MADLRRTNQPDRLLEALIELARSAMRSDREAVDRRAKMHVVTGRRRDAA